MDDNQACEHFLKLIMSDDLKRLSEREKVALGIGLASSYGFKRGLGLDVPTSIKAATEYIMSLLGNPKDEKAEVAT